jgi:NAD+ synthase
MIKNIRGLLSKVKNHIREQTDIAVVGLSGGADSTLVAILCREALGEYSVHGLHMPYNQLDTDTFNSVSMKLANHLGISSDVIDISSAVDSLSGTFVKKGILTSKLNHGNIRSRMRMVSLYSMVCCLAERTGKRVRVVGTGNLSEDYIGYQTKFGDSAADFFPIGELVKSEVYQLLDYFRDQGIITEEMIDRVPSAGLWEGQTDEGELGYTYNQMEPFVLNLYNSTVRHRGIVRPIDHNNLVFKFVLKRHEDNKHKHEAQVIKLREFCE